MVTGTAQRCADDTIVNVWSLRKALSAVCLLRLHDRGQIEVDAPVARHWPEFAQAGKSDLPVRFLARICLAGTL